MFEYKGVRIEKIAHDCFMIEVKDKIIYTDPFKVPAFARKADYIFVTHEHFDHYSLEDINNIVTPKTIFFVDRSVYEQLKNNLANKLYLVKPSDVISVDEIIVKGVDSYNINKFRSPGIVFHPKNNENVGFVITTNGVKFYHTGDSDYIPQMDELKNENIDIFLVPVSGTYVMDAQEAARATLAILPKIAIPMHYGSIVGTIEDAKKFKELLKSSNVEVKII